MTPSDDRSPQRRPIFFPVVIATVFLTIIGMTGGFMLGEWHRDQAQAVETTSPTDTGADNTSNPTPSLLPSDGSCPEETSRTATSLGFPSDLRQVLKIVTKNDTTVWICQDPQGSLYYQGKTGGVDEPWTTKNQLFLSSVVRRSTDEYEAVSADGNQFVVSRERLEVHFTDGRRTQVDKVVTAE